MLKKLVLVTCGLVLGLLIGFGLHYYISLSIFATQDKTKNATKEVIGFLPYWLLDKASTDYSPYLTTLTYFGLPIDADGTVGKFANPQELQPGWNALNSGKVDPFLQNAKEHHIKLSLLMDSGDVNAINSLVENPISHADNLVSDVTPILQQYGFSDLNLDIEYTAQATAGARLHFTQFVKEVKRKLSPDISLTIEISPIDVVRNQLIDIASVGNIADHIVLMAYDYHSPDSFVSGAVAPLSGAGTISEYDVETAIEKTADVVSPDKIILGMPLYGYEWETVDAFPHAAIIPGTGVLASNNRSEDFLNTCASCSATLDNEAAEMFVSYKDQDSGTYHQIFFPNEQSTVAKIDFANKEQLGGLALWALGYEGKSILQPLTKYKEEKN